MDANKVIKFKLLSFAAEALNLEEVRGISPNNVFFLQTFFVYFSAKEVGKA